MGSSLGFVVPREVVKELRLRAGDEVSFEIDRVGLEDAFGSMRDWAVDAQRLKREFRKDWESIRPGEMYARVTIDMATGAFVRCAGGQRGLGNDEPDGLPPCGMSA